MTTIAATFPEDIALREGETFSIKGIARDGALLVTKVVRHEAPQGDKHQAVKAFLSRWTGAGIASMTDEQIRTLRTARLMEKHVK